MEGLWESGDVMTSCSFWGDLVDNCLLQMGHTFAKDLPGKRGILVGSGLHNWLQWEFRVFLMM